VAELQQVAGNCTTDQIVVNTDRPGLFRMVA